MFNQKVTLYVFVTILVLILVHFTLNYLFPDDLILDIPFSEIYQEIRKKHKSEHQALTKFNGEMFLLAFEPHETTISEVFFANFGCGPAGDDILIRFLTDNPDQIKKRKVKGLWVDPKPCSLVDGTSILTINKALGVEESSQELLKTGATKKESYFWALKIDIDSTDCEIAKSILSIGARPKVIIIEVVGCFPPPVKFSYISSPYEMAHSENQMEGEQKWPRNCCFFGCSVQYAIDTMKSFGYQAVRMLNQDIYFVNIGATMRREKGQRYNDILDMFDPVFFSDDNRLKDLFKNHDNWGEYVNLHEAEMDNWINNEKFKRNSSALFEDVSNVFHKKCNADRLSKRHSKYFMGL